MKITQHGQYLTKLTALWLMNCYLVQEDDGYTVVDTTIPDHAGDIIAAVKERGSEIKRIALTHAHMVGSLRVIAAPGHTPGQVAFLDTRDNTLIAGDAYSTQGGLVVTGKVNWLFPLPAFATWHKPTALKTAKALRQLNPSRIATGHGKILENPSSAMDEAIQDAEKAFK